MSKEEEKNGHAERLRRDTHSRGRERRGDPAAEKKTTGRRKKYPKLLRVRLAIEEHKALKQRAKDAGMSLSRYIIESAIRAEAAPQEPAVASAMLAQRDWAIYEVSRVGNNLNQIARQLNSQRGTLSSKLIEQVLIELTQKLAQLRQLWSK